MGELLYEDMLPAQAAEALEDFICERGPSLEQLRATMGAHDPELEALLTGTVASVDPVWVWLSAQAHEHGLDPQPSDKDPTRTGWPSWARHVMLVNPHPPTRTLALVDGFTSYLAEVISTAAPDAHWDSGRHRIENYPLLNYPVLTADSHQVFLPGLPLHSAYLSADDRDPMSGTEMLAHTRRTITALQGQGQVAEEPLVTVVADVDCFDVGLRADLAADHADLVQRLVTELTGRDGIASVYRYGPEALVIDAPSWNEAWLKLWLTLWLDRHLHTET